MNNLRTMAALGVFLASVVKLPGSPNDPQYPGQWNLAKVGATDAWALSTGSDVVVAIIAG